MNQFDFQTWTVKAHGIQAVKLCSLGVGGFKVLKKLRCRFVEKLWNVRKGFDEVTTPPHKKNALFGSPVRDISRPVNDHQPPTGYEPTGIWSTRDSFFWAWRRVGECLKEWFGDEADGYSEALALMRN
jgi:hypothetical protein